MAGTAPQKSMQFNEKIFHKLSNSAAVELL